VTDADPIRPEAQPTRGSTWGRAGLALMLAVYAALAVGSARQKSVTVDELGHLPSGAYYLATGDPHFASLNPPLVNALSALPVFALELAAPLQPPEPSEDVFSFWDTGYHFMESHRADYLRVFAAARLVPIAIVAALAVLLYAWGRRLETGAPEWTGLLAAGLVCLSPNVIAHARLVGTDTGTAFFVALAVFAFAGFLARPSAARSVLCGAALGLALLSKLYAWLLPPVFAVLLAVWHRSDGGAVPLRRRCAGLAAAGFVAWLVFNGVYGWREVGAPLAQITLQSETLRAWQATAFGAIPIPLPAAFVRAVDGQISEIASPIPTFLFGESFQGGRWYTYPALLAIKTPLGLAVAFALAVALAFRRDRLPLRESALLLLYPATLFVLLSLSSGRQLGARALLSAVPLVWLWAAATIARARPARWPRAIAGVALAATAGASIATYPDYLSYFNPFAGGRDGGHRYTAEGNVDIGQDLVQLARWLERNGDGRVQLLYFGSVDPALYGIDFEIPVGLPKPGLMAVSVSLYHMPYLMYADGELHTVGPAIPSPSNPPIATIGGSIHVYRIAP